MPLAVNGFKVCSKKDCPHNGEPQPIDNFRNQVKSKDGKRATCKDCLMVEDARYRQTDARKESLHNYDGSEKGKATRKKFEKTDTFKLIQKRYNQSDKGRLNQKRQNEAFKKRPDYYTMTRAYNTVHTAIKAGTLPHPTTKICHNCKVNQAREYHHYLGYEPEHRLDVIPLCIECHRNT